MSPKVSSYLKNVARSFGYAIGDTLGTYNPVIKNLTEQTKDVAEDLYDTISSFSFKKENIDEKSLLGQVKNSINDIWENFKEDIKTGNLYNKSRQEQMEKDTAKSMGFDFDFEEDFNFDFEEEVNFDTEEGTSEASSAKEIVDSVNDVGYSIAETLGSATVESAGYIVASNKEASKAIYALTSRGFGNVSSALVAINDTISSFAQIGEPLTTHMQNSGTFFTNTSKTLTDIYQSIQNIEKNTQPKSALEVNRRRSTTKRFGDLFSDDILSFTGIKDVIEENTKSYKDSVQSFIDMGKQFLGISEDVDSYGKNVSLAQMGLQQITKAMLPKAFRDSMVGLNEALKYAISGGLVRLRDTTFSNPILDTIKDVLMPSRGYKETVNPGNYEKGPVSWDGVARKALIDVIPITLFKIYSALTGTDEMRYDYNSGRFVTISSISNSILERRKQFARTAGGDFRIEALNNLRNNTALTDEQRATLENEIEQYFLNALTKGRGYYNIYSNNFNAQEFGLTDQSLKILRDTIQQQRASENPLKRFAASRFISDVQREADEYGDYNRREEQSGIGLGRLLEDGSIKVEKVDGISKPVQPTFITDEYNHSPIFYLQGIYQYTGFLADNLGYISGNETAINKREKLSRSNAIKDIILPDGRTHIVPKPSIAGEKTKKEASTGGGAKNRLSYVLSKDGTIVTKDGRAVSNEDLDKYLASGGIVLSKEGQSATEEEIRSAKSKRKIEDAKNQTKNKLKNLLNKEEKDSPLVALYKAPFNAVTNLLTRLSFSLDRLIWGDEDDPETGLFGFIFKKTNEFRDWLKEKFKGMFKKSADQYFGEFRKETLGSLKDAGEWMTGTVGDFVLGVDRKKKPKTGNVAAEAVENAQTEPVKEAEGKENTTDTTATVDSAAFGKKVTKTGLVAVSEGEMIIPSEMNPFYKKKTDKKKQVRDEQNVIKRFFGSYAPGTPVVEETKGSAKQKKEPVQYGGIVGFFQKGLDAIKEGAVNTAGKLSDLRAKNNTEEKDKQIISNVTQEILTEAGSKKGAMGAGALIGAGVSLVSGVALGPLFGAAIGSAVGLVANSKKVQSVLFGADPETGEVNGGLLSKGVSQFIMNHVPSMAKGGAIGMIGGLFMGSPILGALLGSTVGFVASSEKAKKYIFGDEQEEGIIPKDLQDKIKKAVPNIAAGAIGGLFLGPFGIVGNMLLGSGVGFLTTSEKFHDYMFGTEHEKGLVTLFKEKIFDNLDEIFHNMGNAIKGWGKNLIRSTSERIKDFFTRRARAYENGEHVTLVERLLYGTVGAAGKAAKGATNLVGGLLGGINSRLRARNLSRGYGVYDREQRRNMFAGERVQARGDRARGTFANLDRLIASAGSKEELQQLQSQLEDVRDPNRIYKRETNKALNQLYDGLRYMDPKDATAIAKDLQRGRTKNIDRILGSMSEEERAQYTPIIDTARQSINQAKDSKATAKDALARFKEQGINLKNQGDLNSAIDQIKYEMKNTRFTPEEVEKKKENDWRDRVLNIFRSIDRNIAALVGGKAADKETTDEANKIAEDAEKTSLKDKILNTKDEVVEKLNGARVVRPTDPDFALVNEDTSDTSDSDIDMNKASLLDGAKNTASRILRRFRKKDKETKVAFDFSGNIHEYERNNRGRWIKKKNSAITDKSSEKMDHFMKSIGKLAGISSSLSALKLMFKGLGDKLFGSKEEKGEGIFSKLLGFLGGEDGPLSWLFNLFSGAKNVGGSIIKSTLGKTSLGGVILKIIGPALLAAGFAGKFDDLAHSLTGGAYGKGGDSNIYYDKETGNAVTKDENGNYIDSEGNIIDDNNIGVREGDVSSFSERLRYNTVRGAVTGTKSVASTVMSSAKSVFTGKNKKTTTSLASKVLDVTKTVGDDVANAAARSNLIETITQGIKKLTSVLKTVPQLKGLGSSLDNIAAALAKRVAKAASSSVAKTILNTASNLVVWAKVIVIGIDFSSGYDDARTTLGIMAEPTFGQRIISGLIRAIKGFIPVIGTLIPDSLLVDVFCEHIAPALGIDVDELMKQREELTQATDEHNQKYGTDLTEQEYVKTVLEDYTWTERIGNAAKSTWNNIKDRTSNLVQGVKEKGVFGYLGDSIKGMASDFATAYQESGGGISGVFSGIGTTFKNLLPGVFGEGQQKNMEILSLAAKGKLSELWNVSLDDFSGGDVNEYGVETAVPTVFSKIIGNVPLIGAKLLGTPIALVVKLLGKAKDLVLNIGEFFKGLVGGLDDITGASEIMSLASSGDISGVLHYSNKDEDDNGFVSFIKAIPTTIMKLPALPVALVSSVGKGIGNLFNGIVDSVKNIGNIFTREKEKGLEIIYDPDSSLSDMFTIEEDPDNPLNGFEKAISIAGRIASFPVAAVRRIGRDIKNAFNNLVAPIKNSFTTLVNTYAVMDQYIKAGDAGGMWDVDMQEDPNNPVGGITKALLFGLKVINTPVAGIHWVGNKIGEFFGGIVNSIKNSLTTLSENNVLIQQYSKEGDISGLWGLDIQEDPKNPVGGITKALFVGMKVINTPITGIRWVGNKIGDFFSGIAESVSTNYQSFSAGVDAIKTYAKEGDLKSIWAEKLETVSGDPIRFVWSVGFTINKLFQSVVAIFHKILGPVQDAIDSVKGFFGDVGDWFGEKVENIKEGFSNFGSWLGEKADNAFQSFKNWASGGGSGTEGTFISQLDPKYKSMKLGDSTVGQKGCAPAVASMVANNYDRDLRMDEAIRATTGYQTEEGTSIDYFSKILNKKGISTQYLQGDNVPGQIMQNLANGQQVILLGKDPNNTSKENSPFGPNGHYVVATGLDKNGNIIISDPESKQPRTYNRKILDSAKMGVSTGAYGSGTNNYDTEIAKKVWSFFTSNGYTPAATAGIMGNFYAESGLKPDVIQGGGKGPAAGIAQWENYNKKSARWKDLYNYATERGYQWTELTPQLEFAHKEIQNIGTWLEKDKIIDGYNVPAMTVSQFKAITDPQMAALQFEKGFERAGKPRMDARLKAAEEYYKLYQDSSYTGNYTPDEPNPNASVGVMSSGLADTSSSDSSNTGLSGIISAISTAFSDAFSILTGSSSSSESGDYATSYGTANYSSGSTTPIDLSNIPSGKGNTAQKRIVQYATSILGKNQYSQDANLRTKVESGYSDCSSFAQWAYKNALGIDPGSYTEAQIKSPLLTTIDNGTTPNQDNLEAGDLLFFRSSKNNGRYENVGHVEIYDGNGHVIGHGGGKGPVMRDLDTYIRSKANANQDYIETRRYKDIATAAGGSSGLLLDARPGSYVYGEKQNMELSIPKKKRIAKMFSGGASMLAETTNMLNQMKSNLEQTQSTGTISTELVEKLLQSIISILTSISNNTSVVDKIYNVLVEYTNMRSATSTAAVATVANRSNRASSTTNTMEEIDANFKNLVGTLAAIARG